MFKTEVCLFHYSAIPLFCITASHVQYKVTSKATNTYCTPVKLQVNSHSISNVTKLVICDTAYFEYHV